jgi:hypothetical protein
MGLLTPFGKHMMIDFFNSTWSWELLLFNFSKEEEEEEEAEESGLVPSIIIPTRMRWDRTVHLVYKSCS